MSWKVSASYRVFLPASISWLRLQVRLEFRFGHEFLRRAKQTKKTIWIERSKLIATVWSNITVQLKQLSSICSILNFLNHFSSPRSHHRTFQRGVPCLSAPVPEGSGTKTSFHFCWPTDLCSEELTVFTNFFKTGCGFCETTWKN